MLAACILTFALNAGIDPDLVHAVIKTESNYKSDAVGFVGEIGLLQVRPEYVPETAEELKKPCVNIRRGVSILAEAKKLCRHKLDKTWVNCYNLGVVGGSKIKYPKLFPYYKKVIANYNIIKEEKSATKQR